MTYRSFSFTITTESPEEAAKCALRWAALVCRDAARDAPSAYAREVLTDSAAECDSRGDEVTDAIEDAQISRQEALALRPRAGFLPEARV